MQLGRTSLVVREVTALPMRPATRDLSQRLVTCTLARPCREQHRKCVGLWPVTVLLV